MNKFIRLTNYATKQPIVINPDKILWLNEKEETIRKRDNDGKICIEHIKLTEIHIDTHVIHVCELMDVIFSKEE